MTISVQSNKNTYTANGVLTTFAYTFKIFNDSDLTVTTIAAGVTTSYTLDVDYTVTGAPGTGNVVFTTAPTDTHTVVILGTYDYLQSTDYEDGDSFPAATHENALDKSTMLSVKHRAELDNTVQFPITYTDGVVEMEVPATGEYLRWGVDGLGSAVVTSADLTDIVTFETLLANGDIGSGVSQVQRGSVVATNTANIATASGVGAANATAITANTTLIGTTSGTLQANIDANTALITTISGELDDHSEMNGLDYASAGHTGFQPAGDYATNTNLTNVSGTADNNTSAISDNTTLIATTSGTLQDQIDNIELQNAGKVTLASGITNRFIDVSPVQPDTDYSVSVHILNSVDDPPSFYLHIINSTTVSGFSVLFSGAIDSTNYSIDWTLMR